ncbi:DUF3043 domain-containing protein [Arthrobacter sp. I2-34]|uniref:DUF3043 domain-containing protein n=1 Tax=Arthrobacter hankyongi TaxID=2904801 RepID=A0ABS9L6A8_9MICC|nr:DUF3043 domain-containing protein [Arthrobacter hankyongi]MCG2622217.1 DUF3043 domain-containing protein [Arthrobacter hankyongi]
MPDGTAGKGTPTPRRKDQEAARRRPLVPQDRKAAQVANRDAVRAERIRMREAMNTGDERYLPLRDKGPQKKYVRDFVDARWVLGEFLIVFALVFVVLSFIRNIQLQSIILVGFWVLLAVVAVDAFILARQLKKRLTAKFGQVERGAVWYGVMRGLQLRKLRLPKPQVKRGQYPA